MKHLAVFDFDHTIVDDNSDTAILTLAGKDNIPHEIKEIQYKEGWTAFMQGVFTFLSEKGAKPEDMKNVVKSLPSVPGIVDLIKELNSKNYDSIIISDSNSYFIRAWLEENGLTDYFIRVFTNPCKIDDDQLKISPFHIQDSCKLSTRNMCKGQILEEFLESQYENGIRYDKVIYVGDGANDFCPVLKLKTTDLACMRKQFKLCDLVHKAKTGMSLDNSGQPHIVKADLLTWESGQDILNYIINGKQ